MDSGAWGPADAALGRFRELLGCAGGDVDLDEAALTISAVLQPGLDVIGAMAALDELAGTCPSPTREGLAQHLFVSEQFIGDRTTYADWRNSCLDHVIDHRRGIPISLSVVMIEVGRRLGVPLVGIGMPAHFLVGDPSDPSWFVDPFDGGRFLDRDGCRELLERVTRGQVPWRESHLDPTPGRAVIARMLTNLRAGFGQRGDHVRLALVMRMRIAIPELAAEQPAAIRAQSVLN